MINRIWHLRKGKSLTLPILSILTVAFRPRALWNLQQKLARQTSTSFEHVVVMDEGIGGSGWAWVAQMWKAVGQTAEGEYITLMNDDEEPSTDTSVEALITQLARTNWPDVLVVGLDYQHQDGRREILPCQEARRTHGFVAGGVGPQCLVMRSNIWKRHADLWTKPVDGGYAIDLAFMAEILNPAHDYRIVWSDLVFTRMVSRGMGRPE